MNASVVNPSAAVVLPPPDPTITVRRISFVEEAPAGAAVRREFRQPRRMVAVEVAFGLAEFPGTMPGGPTDSLDIVIVPSGSDVGPLRQAMVGMAQPGRPGGDPPLSIKLMSGSTVEWRPTRAIIRASDDDTDELLNALIDFGFFEGELRTLERIVESREAQAREDVGRAHRISRRDRMHWTRIGETIESLARARLTFARLEPMFANASRALSPLGRRLMKRLSARAGVSERLAALSGRLEALEDLYEGANDRIADYRGWHKGHVMEIIIILLLLLEIVLMAGDMSIHYLEFRQ